MTLDEAVVGKTTWEKESELRRTWAGDLTIDAVSREAVLTIDVTSVDRFRLRIPVDRLESLIREFDWARSRLQPPWTGHETDDAATPAVS